MHTLTCPEKFPGSHSAILFFRALFVLVTTWALLDVTQCICLFLIPVDSFQWSWSWLQLKESLSILAGLVSTLLIVFIGWDLQRGQFLQRRNLTRLSVVAACCGIQMLSQMVNALRSQFGEHGGYYSSGSLVDLCNNWTYALSLLVAFSFWTVFALLFARALRLDEENRLTI